MGSKEPKVKFPSGSGIESDIFRAIVIVLQTRIIENASSLPLPDGGRGGVDFSAGLSNGW
jgi:hypothetical protein